MKFMAADRPADAIKVFSAEPTNSPCYGLAFAQIGLAQLVLGNPEQAITAAQTALAAFDAGGCPFPPMGVLASRTVGDALAHSERPVQAITHYLAAIELADGLAVEAPEHADFLEQEKAITLTHLAGACNRVEQYQPAIDYLAGARVIYGKHPAAARLGLPLALENLALACWQLGAVDRAGYALGEALGRSDLSPDQRMRLELTRVQVNRPPTPEAWPVVQRAVDEALQSRKWDLAAVRCGMGIIVALANNDTDWAKELLNLVETIEPKLAADSLWPARLNFYRADLLKRAKAPASEIRRVLVIGAHHWCSRSGGRGELADYQFMAGQMSDHFRLLARNCLDAGMTKEAFVSFEAGRARGIVAEMRNNLSHALVATSPFNLDGEIDLGPLQEIQGRLAVDDVIVCLASVPPTTVCFVVGRASFDMAEIETPVEIGVELRLIPDRLSNYKGLRAVPQTVQDLAQKIVPLIGARVVRALIPYRSLHLVPWRALLKHAGLAWNQLRFGVSFSPTLHVRHRIDTTGCRAIGYGTASGIDLNEEAKEFAALFGASGRFIRDASKADFHGALGAPSVTLVSCHGHLATEALGPKVRFALADGRVSLEEVFPTQLRSPLVILSACDSGAYDMMAGDYPVGAAPSVFLRGSAYCACTRFPIRAEFSRKFFPAFGRKIVEGSLSEDALADAYAEFPESEEALWRDLACVELLIRGD
jgi:tetratricopeptide (TPR) repeat protein